MADTDQAQSRSSFSHSTLVLRFFEKHSWRRELEEIKLYKKRDALSLLNPSLSRSRRIDVNKRSKRGLCPVMVSHA